MKPGRHAIELVQGEPWDVSFRYTTGADQTPVDLTGYLVAFTVKRAPGGEVLLALSSADATQAAQFLIGGINGQVQIFLAETDTSVLPAGQFVYTVRLGASATTMSTLFGGQATVTRS